MPSLAIAALGLAGLIAAGLMEPYVAGIKPGRGSDTVLSAPQNASPLVVFTTVALGGFRGLAIDLLWTRVNMLQDDGDYVEIAQLSDWITRLNPLLPAVWDFHSFNMAYNISAMSPSPQDRWRWISSGIRMLRNQAIIYNPHEPQLYDRLCRIYKHKLIDREDPARSYYRVAWATEMADVFGDAAADSSRYTSSPQSMLRLRDEYKLDPAVMIAIEKAYGPLDWRLPETHIIYWATCGIGESSSPTNLSFDLMICEAMGEAFSNGRVVDFRPHEKVLTTDIRADLLTKTITVLESTAAHRGYSLGARTGFGGFYRYFLRNAIVLLHERQLNQQVDIIFHILKDQLHDEGTDRPVNDYIAGIRAAQTSQLPTNNRDPVPTTGQ